MTNKQVNIVELAKEAGFSEDSNCEIYGSYYHLERFAALVREQAYREDKSLTLGFEVTERKFVDLTDDEILKAIRGIDGGFEGFRALITAFKEKNR